MDDVLEAKILALFTLLVLITFSTAIPLKVSSAFNRLGAKGHEILSTLMCFSGGIFLGAYLLHLGPEGVQLMNDHLIEENGIEFPLAKFFIAMGFFLVMITEQFVFYFTFKSRILYETTVEDRDVEEHGVADRAVNGAVNGPVNSAANGAANGAVNGAVNGVSNGAVNGVSNGAVNGVLNGAAISIITTENSTGKARISDAVAKQDHHMTQMSGLSHIQQEGQLAARSIILLVALSMDCIFEGITTGLEDSVGDVWKMVIAIMSHEFVIAFGLGIELVKHNSTMKTLMLAVIYGLTCPIGVTIGILISETGNDENATVDLMSAILICISGGVFLYVTFFQILQGEVTPHMKLHKMLAVFLGFMLISLLIFVTPTPNADESSDNATETLLVTS